VDSDVTRAADPQAEVRHADLFIYLGSTPTQQLSRGVGRPVVVERSNRSRINFVATA